MSLSKYHASGKVYPTDVAWTTSVINTLKDIKTAAETTGALCAGADKFLNVMLKAGVAWYQEIEVDAVGTSPYNRGGMGVTPSDAQVHGAEVVSVGIVKSLAEKTAVALQKHPHEDFELEANNAVTAASNGLLPALKRLEASSIGTSHTNVFFRQVKHRVRSLLPALSDAAGKLDYEKIVNNDDAVLIMKVGIKWLVLHWQLEQLVPGSCEFIQKALNVEARQQRSELEVALDMWANAKRDGEGGKPVNWDAIAEKAGKALCVCRPWLKSITAFLAKHGGVGLEDADAFLKALDRDSNSGLLGGEYWDTVAKLKSETPIPLSASAVIITGFASAYLSDGYVATPSKKNISKLMKKGAELVRADALLADARKLGSSMGVSENPDFNKALGNMTIRTAALLMENLDKFESFAFKTTDELSEDVDVDLISSYVCNNTICSFS